MKVIYDNGEISEGHYISIFRLTTKKASANENQCHRAINLVVLNTYDNNPMREKHGGFKELKGNSHLQALKFNVHFTFVTRSKVLN